MYIDKDACMRNIVNSRVLFMPSYLTEWRYTYLYHHVFGSDFKMCRNVAAILGWKKICFSGIGVTLNHLILIACKKYFFKFPASYKAHSIIHKTNGLTTDIVLQRRVQ